MSMSTGQKVAIGVGVGCVALLLLAGVGALVLGMMANDAIDDLREQGQEVQAQAEAYGQGRPHTDCVNEAFRRQADCDGVMCDATNGAWLTRCLEVSQQGPEMCRGVPPPTEIMLSANWRVAECRARGAVDTNRCGNLIASIQTVCSRPR